VANKLIPREEGQLIKSGPEIDIVSAVRPDLFEMRILGKFIEKSGQYVVLPEGMKIINRIYSLLNKYLRDAIEFEEVILPKVAPVKSFRKANVLDKWNDYLLSVKPFSETKGVEEEYILDPLQCTVFYQFHEGKKINVDGGPIKWLDRSGPTYRNEDLDKIFPGVKQREFHRAEFVYLGTPKQVIEIREKCLAQMEKFCIDFGLRYRIVVGASCYQLESGEIRVPENLEEIPIKDLEIYCPGYKNKDDDSWLEIIGSSILAETMTKRFEICGECGEELWSGCTGIGLNRLMYAIISNRIEILEKNNGQDCL